MDPISNGGQPNGHPPLPTRPPSDRPWTFHEALPYSPHTSHTPFVPDIIPNPTLGLGAQALPLCDLLPTNEYDQLNQESYEQLSRNAKQTIDQVLQDLRTSQRTHIKFKSLPDRSISSQTSHPNESLKSLTQDLSPMAKTVYQKVGNYFKTTKTNTPSSPAVNGHGHKGKTETPPAVAPPLTPNNEHKAHNAQSYRDNSAKIEVAISSKPFDRSAYLDIDGSVVQPAYIKQPFPTQQHSQSQFTPTPQDTISAQEAAQARLHSTPSRQAFSIVLEPGKVNREEFIEIENAPEPLNNLSARKKGRRDYADTQEIFGNGLDQRQRGNEAVNALNKVIKSIFDAVGSALAGDSGVEHMVTLNADQEPIITAGLHQKLHAAILKVIGLSAFDRVPVEHLLQLTKLSEASLKQVEELSLRTEEGWDEEAVESWVQQLSDVEVALKASRTCLRILSGGREDKQLYSETLIQRTLTLFRNVAEDIVIPIVEMRNPGPNGPNSTLFRTLIKNKKTIAGIFVSTQKLAAMLAELVTKIELSEMGMNTLEFIASRLIFVENAHFERDSILGIQKFDGLRLVAMDLLCQIFMMKPQQRQGIFDDILTSLEKLPSGRQGSRQFKLAEGGSIQPVSALIMRLVQASAGKIDDSKDVGRAAMLRALEVEAQMNGGQEPPRQAATSLRDEEQAAHQHAVAIQDLESAAAPLNNSSQNNAAYVINFIKTRAMQSTKTGDAPYRNLLDLFVEDFTTCLDSPDWPAAEVLLRSLMTMMVQTFQNPKSAAPSKNMALEILGSMSAAISRLRSQVKRSASALEGGYSDELSSYLTEVAQGVLDRKVQAETIVAWAGPFRTVLEYLQRRCNDDPYLAGAISYLTTAWASRTHTEYDLMETDDWHRDAELGRIAYRLRQMIQDRGWLFNEYTFKAVEPGQARLAYSILVLSSPLCASYGTILNMLLHSMTSDQATVRSKSLKSINHVLETDPSILDGPNDVIRQILDCTADSSIQVRDSALGLLGSCISLRPSLESRIYPNIVERFADNGIGVRKRAMKLARDVYLRNQDRVMRSEIANGLLRRVHDPDEGVRDLARQMIEEIWFAPFYYAENTASFQTALTEHVSLIIQTVKTGTLNEILDKILQAILKPQDKSLEGPFSVCEKLVAIMFSQIDNPESGDISAPSGRDVLQVLPIFAKADPKLFTFEQMRILKPQLSSFSAGDELMAFRAVTVIYRRVLSELSLVHREFLSEVRLQLLKTMGKFGSARGVVDDIIACAKVICDLLQDLAPLANATCSSLISIMKARNAPMSPKLAKQLEAYSIIVGTVAKHCDLDKHIQVFRAKFPQWQGDSVPRLIVDTLVSFASPDQGMEVRRPAIEAIGLVCQAWPRNYVLAKVYTTFQQVFDDRDPVLEHLILRSVKEFLLMEEKRSEAGAEKAGDGKKKSLTVMGGTSFDDVASATTQRFLKDITRIAISSQDEYAFLAMEVLGSINRQGLVHPKETGVTLMTLETSANKMIAELAFAEHRSLHEKHETVLEREYVKAVQAAYEYQRDVVGDAHGVVVKDDFQPKLHLLMDVLKISKMKNRQRFVEKLCGQVEFDLGSLDASGEKPEAVYFARFILENLAFFEFQTVGEIHSGVSKLEKMMNVIGVGVAQAIESEVFNVRMEGEPVAGPALVEGGVFPVMAAEAPGPSVSPGRLRQLAAASTILNAVWETRTYLRRLYGMGAHRNDAKAKEKAKDLNKSPTKVQGIPSEKFYDELCAQFTGLDSAQQMIKACKAFVETLSVDKDFKVAEEVEDDEMEMEGPSTPSEAEEGDEEDGGERGRKRKGTLTPGGRAKRARSSSQPRKRGRPHKNPAGGTWVDGDGDWM